jgi:hypothetical protein
MRKTLPWLLFVGLFVFVAIYAFVFPESQMPVRIRTDKVWTIEQPIGQRLFESDDFIILKNTVFAYLNDEWIDIGLPPITDRVELPYGLEWPEPAIAMAHAEGGTLYAVYSSLTRMGNSAEVAVWDGGWSREIVDDDVLGLLKLCASPEPVSAEILKVGIKSKIRWNEETIEIDTPDIAGSWTNKVPTIREYTYQINDDGRIERLKDGIVTAVSSRDELNPFLVQTEIISDGESIYVLLENRSENEPEGWVQILNRDLSHNEFIVTRYNHQPVSVAMWGEDTLLMLWDDGVLNGYSMWGQEKFSFNLCLDQPLDMVSTGSVAYVLSDRGLLLVSPTARKSRIDVWPRIKMLGLVEEPQEFTLFIGTESMPVIQTKGNGIQLILIMGYEDGMLATFSVNPDELPSFSRVAGEILVETEEGHEVVPCSFIPSGLVREFKIFSDVLLDLESGEMVNYEFIGYGQISIDGISPEIHKVYFDQISGKVFLVTPKPFSPIDLDVSMMGPQIDHS